MMLRSTCFLFLLAGLALADTQSGTVRSGGQPIPGATVQAQCGDDKLSTITDENGAYMLGGVTSKPCKFTVEMHGFAPVAKEAGASDKALDFDLSVENRAEAMKREAAAQEKGMSAAKPAATPASPGAPAPPATPTTTATAPARGGQRPAAAGTQTARNGQPQGRQQQQNGGFQNVNLVGNGDTAGADAGAGIAPGSAPTENAGANESFLVNGSLSQGIQQTQPDFGGMDPGMRDAMMNGGGAGGPGGFGGGAPGGFGGGGGRGGPGGGGPGGGGFGGGPGGGGGFAGGGGRGGPGGGRGGDQRPTNRNAQFGNRINRGRNQWRGSANYTLQNSAFDARPFSLTGNTVTKAAYASNRYGFSAGGPFVIPKVLHSYGTFLFINYTGQKSRQPYNGVTTVPTAAERNGDFSGISNIIYDPLTSAPFAGNRIPSTRIDPIALGLLKYIPLQNQTALVQNYQFVASNPNNNDNLNVRATQTLGKKDNLSFNVNYQNRNGRNAQTYGFFDESNGYGLSTSFTWSHTFNRSNINRFGWNFSRNISHTIPYFQTLGIDIAAQLGITGTSHSAIDYGPPTISFTNFGALTDATSSVNRSQTSSLTDSFIHILGKHTLTVGGEFRRQQSNPFSDSNGRGSFSFTGISTSGFTSAGLPLSGTGYDFADYLLSLPNTSSVRFGATANYFRTTVANGYLTDDFKYQSNLTFNTGLRYEYFTPTSEKYGRLANIDLAPGYTAAAVVTPGMTAPYSGGTVPDGIVKPQHNLISPRIGVAWKPWKKKSLMIRTGYGIYFNGSAVTTFASRLAAQPPFAKTATLQSSTGHILTLANGFPTQPSSAISNSFAIDPNYSVGYAQSWNFAVSYSLPRNWTMEATYLGTKGTDLDILVLPNQASPGSPLTAEQRRAIGNAVGFTLDTAQGNSSYNSGQLRLIRRFTRGVSLNNSFTYAKSIDNASSLNGAGGQAAQNIRDLRAERGLSSFDQRYVYSSNFVLTSPINRDQEGLKARLLKDWTLNGGISANSGTPYTARVLGNAADSAGTGASGNSRASATGQSVTAGSGYFNLAAFMIPASGTFGNASRNTIPGIARWNANLSFGRSFRLDDRRQIEFRADSNNFLNHVNITGVQTVVNSINYGYATGAGGMRTVNMSLRLRF